MISPVAAKKAKGSPQQSNMRRPSADERLTFRIATSSLGLVCVALSEKGVAAILLGDDRESLIHMLQTRFPHAELVQNKDVNASVFARIVRFIEQPNENFEPTLDMRGTDFQQRVWFALCTLPSGATVSYTELAQRIGAPKAVRAVASACAANVHAVVVPCHRVLRADGGLAGYAWGLARKRALLAREAFSATNAVVSDLFEMHPAEALHDVQP